jgi:apolipoprotein N-acyltransferase
MTIAPLKVIGLCILTACFLALPFFEHCPLFLQPVLPILGLTLLLKLFSSCSKKQAFFYGWLTGFVFFGLGVSWVYISIHDFGDVPFIQAAGMTAAFALFLGIFYGIWGYLLNFFSKIREHTLLYHALFFPFTGVGAELLKAHLFSGFPWLEMGVTQLNSPLAGFAPIVGSYGIGFLMFLIAGLLYIRKLWALLIVLFILIAGHTLKWADWTHLSPKPITVSVVQGNIPQSLKWDENNVLMSLKRYQELSLSLPNSDLILWPETAIPLNQIDAHAYLYHLDQWLKKDRPFTTLIAGLPFFEPSSNNYFNAALALGEGHGIYFKQHLVPFGEYLPWRPLFEGIFRVLNIPMSDFAMGEPNPPLIRTRNFSLATFICYESAYSNLVARSAEQAGLLIVLSDDAWFGDSAGPYQHLQINQMRALENGRYLISSTNNGVSAVIDPEGRVVKKIPRATVGTLTSEVFLAEGRTPFEGILASIRPLTSKH